jgi:hypothetical protein
MRERSTHTIFAYQIGRVIASVRLLSVFWVQIEQNGATEASDSLLFPCASLHGFVLGVGRNCAHNPKVVSSNLPCATRNCSAPVSYEYPATIRIGKVRAEHLSAT